MARLKAILFDMDDTLLDWSKITVEWDSHDRVHLGYVFDYVATLHPLYNRQKFYEIARNLIVKSWEEAQGTLNAPQLGNILIESCVEMGVPRELLNKNNLLEAYQWGLFPGVTAFPDVLEVLPDLHSHGLQLGVVTNAFSPMYIRDNELEQLGLLSYFTGCRISAADVGYLKPHPAIFEVALRCLNITPDEVIFIGDSAHADIVGAQSVGMKAILRSHFVHIADPSLHTGVEPDATIETLYDLYPILDRWYNGWRRDKSVK